MAREASSATAQWTRGLSGEVSWSSTVGLDNTLGEKSSMLHGLSYDGYMDHNTPGDCLKLTDEQLMILPKMAAEPNSNLSPNVSRATNTEADNPEDWEFVSNESLNYIGRMLMEEDIDEKVNMYQESATFRVAAKPFYDVLGHKFPPSPDRQMMPWSLDSPIESSSSSHAQSLGSTSDAVDNNQYHNIGHHQQMEAYQGLYGQTLETLVALQAMFAMQQSYLKIL